MSGVQGLGDRMLRASHQTFREAHLEILQANGITVSHHTGITLFTLDLKL